MIYIYIYTTSEVVEQFGKQGKEIMSVKGGAAVGGLCISNTIFRDSLPEKLKT